jgi:sigma-B regulation protein RsbU (phosphoserine phosphatase)
MELDIRKVTFPINIKLTFIVLLLTGGALFFYVWLAIDLFKTDKIAYVFESVDQQNTQVSVQVKRAINNIQLNHNLLKEIVKSEREVSALKKSYPHFAGFINYQGDKVTKKFIFKDTKHSDFLGFLQNLNQETTRSGIRFVKVGSTDYITYFLKNSAGKSLSFYNIEMIKSLIPESELYHYNLILNDELLIEDSELNLAANSLQNFAFQTFVNGKGNHKKIIALIPLYERELGFVTWIHYQKAIEASQTLQTKSLYFGVLVAGVVIIFILLFSNFITRPIKSLYASALELSNSNFKHRTNIKQSDEIGVLGDSFNYMADKIEDYMAQMEEKIRLENELKTAQLVQESFFPTDKIEGKNLKLKAFYKPASECGGDWWGYISRDEYELVILVDVTGHGTAAALMTAIVQNSLTSLKYLADKDISYMSDSAKVMDFLNQSIASVDINLNATCFVASFKGHEMNYTNASHNPPYLTKHKDEYKKADFIPLLENLGPRLGEDKNAKYSANHIDISANDHLTLYTDGILEAINLEGKAFGTRNFIKALQSDMNNGFEKSLEMTIKRFYEYIGDKMPDDDITLIRIDLV